jgi:hypothetical protein
MQVWRFMSLFEEVYMWHFSHTHSQMSLSCVVLIENPMYLLEVEACRSIDKPLILQSRFNLFNDCDTHDENL